LSPRAATILDKLEKLTAGEFVFPDQARGKPLSNMAMEMVLRRMKVKAATVHGFRSSSFRDWAGNVSNFPREITETHWRTSSAIKRNRLIDAATH
jgi:hypothetical protein